MDDDVTLQEWADEIKAKLESKPDLLTIYPVGSVYQSDQSESPAALFGGEWTPITDRFLYGSGSKEIGSTGGEERHTLIIDEIPAHTHDSTWSYRNGNVINQTYNGFVLSEATAQRHGSYISVLNTGGSKSHNNMPPYTVINIWKRVA